MSLSRDEAREYMRTHAEEILKPDRASERSGFVKGYVCPICGSGTHDKGTGITTRDGIHFTCWAGCFSNADIIDIIGLSHGLDEDDHVRKFEEAAREFGISIEDDYDYQQYKVSATKTKPLLKSQSSKIEEIDYRNFFLEANKNLTQTTYHRGISLETLNKFQVGYVSHWRVSENAPYSPRLIIPTYECGYLARDTRENLTDEEQKYAKLRRGHVVIFNRRAISEAVEPIFVVEGELDCLSVIDAGGMAIGLGSVVNVKRLLSELKEHEPSQPLIISLDRDKSGEMAASELETGLREQKIFFYRYEFPRGFKDANEYLMKDRRGFEKWVSLGKSLAEGEFSVFSGANRKDFDDESVSSCLSEFVKTIQESREGKAIPTGFGELDKILDGGLYPGFYVIGAISSLGKTTFALQVADQIAGSGRGVLIFSLEMSRNELMAKSLSRLTFVEAMGRSGSAVNAKTTRGILRGKFYGTEQEVFEQALRNYEQYGKKVHISEGIGNIGVKEIKERIGRYIECFGGDRPVVLIDYLQILAPYDIRATDKQNTDKAVLELKRLSRDYEIPVIAVSSFNRENYFSPVSMASFKESGAIEYSSDVLLGLQYDGWDYMENEKEQDRSRRLRDFMKSMEVNARLSEEAGGIDTRVIQLKILKHRNGRRGSLRLEFVPKYNYFKSMDHEEECPF